MSLPTQMRVVEMSEFGEPDVLIESKRDLPEVPAETVLIKVIAAGVNGPDLVQRRGHYPPPKGASDLLGLEVSGEIVDVGCDQTKWSIGDRVCALTNGGGYAEYVAVDARHCLPIPNGVNEQDAAGLPETYFTVWSNIFFNQKIKDGTVFLVHGGLAALGPQQSKLARPWAYKSLQRQVQPMPVHIVRILGHSVRSISMKRILSQSCVKLVEQILF